jgi:hypothetical protein
MIDEGLTGWLLQASTPSIRYLTLTRLLDQPASDPTVQAARQAIMTDGPVPGILETQQPGGHWFKPTSFYSPKYVSTHWMMILLAEMHADGSDPRLRDGAAYMLQATEQTVGPAMAAGRSDWTCLHANLLRYVAHCGLMDDPRTGQVIAVLVADSGEVGWRCRHNGDLPCAWGAARALWGLAALPPDRRTPEVAGAIERGVDFLVSRADSLVKAAYPTRGRASDLWSRLNFPLFYQVDTLFVLRVLAELGALERPGVGPALDWLEARRDKEGRWRGSSPYRGRTWNTGGAEETSRWVSLHAAIVLRQAGR